MMRRTILLLVLLGLLLSGSAHTAAGDRERDRLQGDWQITSVIEDGLLVPDTRVRDVFVREGRISIRGAIISFTNPENGKVQESAFVVDPEARPRTIDLASSGRSRSKGIYVLDGDTFIVCLAPADAKDRPDEFGSRKGTHNLLINFKRSREKTRTITVSSGTTVVRGTSGSSPATPVVPAIDTTEKMRKALVGTWGHQNNDDVVLITFNKDGSFSATRTPRGGFRRIFREPVRSSGSWKLEDGVIVVRLTASTDRDLQNQILSYRIRGVSETQLVMIDSTGRMHTEWKTP